jgi:VanZ family protein
MRVLAAFWFVLWATFSIPWATSSPTPQWDRVRPPRVGPLGRVRPTHVLNFLFYIPVVPLGSRLGWSLPTLVVTGATLSLTAEAGQLFSRDRIPDVNDVILNVAGTLVGAALVYAARRRRRGWA